MMVPTWLWQVSAAGLIAVVVAEIVLTGRSGRGSFTAVTAYSHVPFRFVHCFRAICGRGYSGSTRSGVTSAAHRVRRCVAGMGVGACGCAAACRARIKKSNRVDTAQS